MISCFWVLIKKQEIRRHGNRNLQRKESYASGRRVNSMGSMEIQERKGNKYLH